MCLAYEIPLLSGKDSMYVDGHLTGRYGETHKVSALETMQFSATSIVDDVSECVTMDAKIPGDLVYVLGLTRNELGGSEYYEHLGFIGCNVPEVTPGQFTSLYRALNSAIRSGQVASAHGIYQGRPGRSSCHEGHGRESWNGDRPEACAFKPDPAGRHPIVFRIRRQVHRHH